MVRGNNTSSHHILFSGWFAMSDIFPDLEKRPPKQLELDFNKKDLEPIPFGNRKIEIKDMFNSNKLRAWFNEQNK